MLGIEILSLWSISRRFPIKTDRDYKSCRIFGHDCPVFYVAEPITETKELRRITRSIQEGSFNSKF